MTDRINEQRASGESRSKDKSRQSDGLIRREPETSRGMSPYSAVSSPWELMQRFSEDVDRMFSSMGFGGPRLGMMGRPLGQRGPGMRSLIESRGAEQVGQGMGIWTPRVDVTTRGDDLVIEAELPGINPDDVEIEAEGNRLIIRGEARDERSDEDKERGYWYSERKYGSFFRTIPLPEGVNADTAQANFSNGLLEVTFPGVARQIRPERRRIAIQGSSRPAERQIGQGTGTVTGTSTTTGTQTGSSAQEASGTYGQASQSSEGRQQRG